MDGHGLGARRVIYRRPPRRSLCFANHDDRIWVQAPARLVRSDFSLSLSFVCSIPHIVAQGGQAKVLLNIDFGRYPFRGIETIPFSFHLAIKAFHI